jgi:uncharacterized protein YndB with AHSA1/START domain
MNHELIVSQSIEVNADLSKVWKALTSPEIIKDYLFGTETISDWKVGSPIVFQGDYQGQKYRDHGVILENDQHKKLSYTYWSGFSGSEDLPENYACITYLLEKTADQKTKFTWIQKGFANEAGYEHSKNGMGELLINIKAVIEKI